MDSQVKAGVRAFAAVAALDKRKANGTLDAPAQTALQEAESTLCRLSAGQLLTTYRTWRDSGMPILDPTGGHSRFTEDRSPGDRPYPNMAMRTHKG